MEGGEDDECVVLVTVLSVSAPSSEFERRVGAFLFRVSHFLVVLN